MEEFLNSIGIYDVGEYDKKNVYVIDIDNSNDYDKILGKLDKSDKLDVDEESCLMTIHNASTIFTSDDYILTIIANFDDDTYKLTVKER